MYAKRIMRSWGTLMGHAVYWDKDCTRFAFALGKGERLPPGTVVVGTMYQ